jgi:hypothetical protein
VLFRASVVQGDFDHLKQLRLELVHLFQLALVPAFAKYDGVKRLPELVVEPAWPLSEHAKPFSQPFRKVELVQVKVMTEAVSPPCR